MAHVKRDTDLEPLIRGSDDFGRGGVRKEQRMMSRGSLDFISDARGMQSESVSQVGDHPGLVYRCPDGN